MPRSNCRHPIPFLGINDELAPCGHVSFGYLRLFMAFCIAMFSFNEICEGSVIFHDHSDSHHEQDRDYHPAGDPHEDHHHEEHGQGDDGHHHHLSSSSCGAMMALPQTQHAFYHQATRLTFAQANETCPDSPVFELIKPPQVS